MKTENVTIYDIAREAGVSPATVSRIINGTVNVSQPKRELVEKIMKKYSFVPNAVAKGLSSKETKTIGVLVSDVRNPYYSFFYAGLENAAITHGYNIILCNSLNDDEIEKRQIELMASKSVDVIIICGGRTDTFVPTEEQKELMNWLAARIPIILVGDADYFPCNKVYLDYVPAMEAMMGYLIGLGHKKFSIFGGYSNKVPTLVKQNTFRNILKRNDLPLRDDWLVETSYDITSSYAAAKKFLHKEDLPTAVIAMNESVALGFMRAATEAGLKIPEDMSITSFDNTYLSEISTPIMTSAGCMYDEYGEIVMNLVGKTVAHPEERYNVSVPVGLTVRKSCAKPRDEA